MTRQSFIDWMKAIGMMLIVYGHSSSGTHFFTTDPIYVKQLGVAFFVFAMGYTLAREERTIAYVLFSRLFKILLYGFSFAVFLSIVGIVVRGDIAESNYLPFVLGANVFFNSFPANPTTWFIGTYIHILLLWALLLRRVQPRSWILAAWLPMSLVVRILFVRSLGPYVAYMFLSNWIGVFMLGMLAAGRTRAEPAPQPDWRPTLALATAFGLLLALWPACVSVMPFQEGFPFRVLDLGMPIASWLATSGLIELLYLAGTLLVFNLSRLLPRSRIVEFFSRNTLAIFIFHMPLILALQPHMGWTDSRYLRVLAYQMICYVGLAFVGQLLDRLVDKSGLRSACLSRLRVLKAGLATRLSVASWMKT